MLITAVYEWTRCETTTVHFNKRCLSLTCVTSHWSEWTNIVFKHFKYTLKYEGRVTYIRTAGRRGVYRVLVGKSEGKRPLGRPRRRWRERWLLGRGMGAWTWLIWQVAGCC